MYISREQRVVKLVQTIGFWVMVNIIVWNLAGGLTSYVLDYLAR